MVDSVTRWPDYLFNIWLFRIIKISPIALKICLSRFKKIQNAKLTLSEHYQKTLKLAKVAKFHQIRSHCRHDYCIMAHSHWFADLTIDCVNADIENLLSLCGNTTVYCGICTSVNEPYLFGTK